MADIRITAKLGHFICPDLFSPTEIQATKHHLVFLARVVKGHVETCYFFFSVSFFERNHDEWVPQNYKKEVKSQHEITAVQQKWLQCGIKILHIFLYHDCIQFIANCLTVNVIKPLEQRSGSWAHPSHDNHHFPPLCPRLMRWPQPSIRLFCAELLPADNPTSVAMAA